MFNKQIIDRLVAPHNVGMIKGADAVGTAKNNDLGETAKVYLTVEEKVVKVAKFKVFGCITSIVALDILMDELVGRDIEEITNINFDEIVSKMGDIAKDKLVCLGLLRDVLVDTLKDYHKKQLRLKKLQMKLQLAKEENKEIEEKSPFDILLSEE